jgi:hypothetical protein
MSVGQVGCGGEEKKDKPLRHHELVHAQRENAVLMSRVCGAQVLVAVAVVGCAIVAEWGKNVREAELATTTNAFFKCQRGNEERWGTVGVVEGARPGHL